MADIRLKAKLQAYSKSPFYADYIRNVIINEFGTTTPLEPNTSYIWQGNRWEKMDVGNINEIGDRLLDAENQVAKNKEDLNNISLNIDSNSPGVLKFVDGKGVEHTIDITNESLVDNITINYTDNGKLQLSHPWDNKTITINAETGEMQVSGIVMSGEVVNGNDLDNQLRKIEASIEATNKNLKDIASYINDGSAGTMLPPFAIVQGHWEGNKYIVDPLPAVPITDEYSIQELLSTYAEIQLNIILNEDKASEDYINIEGEDQFPDNVRVQDSYTGNLWIFARDEDYPDGHWYNNGKDLIVSATNDGVLGVVTGVDWKVEEKGTQFIDNWGNDEDYLQGHINSKPIIDENGNNGMSLPTISINGLKERLIDLDKTKVEKYNNIGNNLDVAYIQKANTNGTDQDHNKIDVISINTEATGDTIVKRTQDGRVKTQQPVDNDDAINAKWFNE